ncbi:MAG: 50S ribosomal protein L5 [Betaproteobacteria bacterium]|nr:50S ribosomal protein L5 [Betaproteobacteria bacterium]
MSAAKSEKDARQDKAAKAPQKDAKAPREAKQQPAAPKEAKAPAPAREGKQPEPREAKEAKEVKESRPARPAPVPRLQIHYRENVVKQLMQQFGYKTAMQVPRVEKIVLNMGVGEAVADKKILDNAVADMSKIAGQKPIVTKARKSVATYKIRAGYPIGCKVTLRGRRMYEFLDRLVSIAMPRIRDFRGISARAFDGQGNYNMGVKEQIIFPEIEYDKIDAIRGMNITISTTAKTDNEAKALLGAFRFPFRN